MVSDSGAAGAERQRLQEADAARAAWRRWGPYLSERQWGTVREDYSPDGDAWSYFTHDQARSRAYRWGEDGIAGVSDDKQRLCFALALWNGRDPILKERMFGLTNAEGNHGEDVKEYYFHLDSTPTHSYMKYLYKYPQGEFPYADLVDTNRARGRGEFEYELLDTGIFDEDRYFDVFVEYAKHGPEDVLVEITAHNRGPDEATLHLLPTLWFRHTWSWAGPAPYRACTRPRTPSAPITRNSARAGCTSTPTPPSCSPRTRRTTSASSAARTTRRTSRTASTGTSSTARARPSTPRGPAPRPPSITWWRSPPAAARPCGCGCPTPNSPTPGPSSPPRWRRGGPRPTPSTRTSSRTAWARTSAAWCGRRWPGCCGASSTTTSTSSDGWPSTASTCSPPTPASATAPGTTWSTTRSCRCRTPGSTRGSRPGTSPSTPSPCPWSTSASPRASWSCSCAASICTPTARSPRTNGTSATSTRPSTPGRSCSSTNSRSTARGAPTEPSWRTPSRS